MSKRILVIATGPRRGGNSELLADSFVKGAQEAGHTVEKVTLYDKSLQFCRGCLACQTTSRCPIGDDVADILTKMETAEVVAFATPVYFYGMCGQMKTLLDRTNPLFPRDYAFQDIYLLATAADNDETAMDGTVTGLQGWLDCFEKTRLGGVIRGVGVTAPGEISQHPALLEAARALGKQA